MSGGQDPYLNSDESEPNEDQRKTTCRNFLRTHLLCTELYPNNQEELLIVDDDEVPPAGPLPTRRRLPFSAKRNRVEQEIQEEVRPQRVTTGGKYPKATSLEPEDDIPDLGDYFAGFPELTELDQVKLCRAYANYLSAKDARNRIRYTQSGSKPQWKNQWSH